jgi:hypothetical protein
MRGEGRREKGDETAKVAKESPRTPRRRSWSVERRA